MLKALGDPSHEEHENMLEWVGGRYDPAQFDLKKVRFDSPKKPGRLLSRARTLDTDRLANNPIWTPPQGAVRGCGEARGSDCSRIFGL